MKGKKEERKEGKPSWTGAAKRTLNALKQAVPILIGVIILISIATAAIPKHYYGILFNGGPLDPILGASLGSIAAGSPLTSYLIGGELLTQGVPLIAVSAFLLAWVTVGIIQLPAEIAILGKRFALLRNSISFVLAIAAAFIVVFLIKILGGGL